MVLATSASTPYKGPVKDKQYCESLAKKIASVSDLPDACMDFDSVQRVLQSRKTIKDPYAGMPAGSASSARANRSKGQEHHAKIQRRMTTGATTGVNRFSKLDK